MTQEQVNADKPPAIRNDASNCDTKVLSQSPDRHAYRRSPAMAGWKAWATCEISWRGNEHYEGTYNFKGACDGHPQEITTHYTGDFVKADCGAVKP